MKDLKKRAILIYLMGFLVARAVFFDINPLSIGFFTAAYLERAGGGLTFIAVILGLVSVMPYTLVIKYFLAMAASVVLLESPLLKRNNVPRSILYILPPLALSVFSMMETAAGGWKPEAAALAALEAVIAFISGIIFKRGIDYLLHETKGIRINNEQMVSLAFLVAIIIYAFPEYESLYIAPVETVVYFIILFFTYKYGIGQGTVAGAVSGFAVSLRGAPLSGAGALTMMGIIPAIFREMGRIPTATVFTVTAVLIGQAFEEMTLTTREIGALASAVLIFLLLPKSLIYRVDSDASSGREYLASQNLKKIANSRMKIFSDSFLKLSKTLEAITEKQTKIKQQEINYIFEDISDKLCKNCSKCSLCWEKNFSETYQSACMIFDLAEKNGFIKKEEVPNQFLSVCTNADQFILETNRGFEIVKLNHIWGNRMAESREVIAEQLKEVSSVIQDITAGDIYGSAQVIRLEEEKVLRRLRAEHILVRNIAIIERGDKRKEIYLGAAAGRGRCITAKETAVLIGETLGLKIRVSDASKTVLSKDYDNFIFVEDTKFKVLTGVARAMKDNVSGDNFSLLKLENGEYMLALSDGMGTGKEAGEESETVLSLLEQLTSAGFKSETAIKLINSSLVLKADKQTFSTIDLGIINLYTGMCEFTKIGAASAFIKRDNWVETISSTTLPIGMFGNVDYDSVTKKLYEGDIIIMVTDGVLDSIKDENKEAYMEKLIADLKSSNPQEIANRILDNMLAQSNYVPVDDMTVLTAGIWLK